MKQKSILSLYIHHDHPNLKLTLLQELYSLKILERFGMEISHPISTPMELEKVPVNTLKMKSPLVVKHSPYREPIGRFMFLMIGIRPNLEYSMGKLSQFCKTLMDGH